MIISYILPPNTYVADRGAILLRHRLHRFPASPSAIHELLPLISCSSGRAAGDLVGCLLSLSACRPRMCAAQEFREPLTAPVQPNDRARHTDSTAAHPAQSRQLISLVFTSPWRACAMHTRINQPSNGPSHGAKRTPIIIRPTPKPPSHCVHTSHSHTSRLPPVPRKLPSLFCAHIRAHATARF